MSVCTKFEDFILIHAAWMQNKAIPMFPSNSFGRGPNNKVTLGCLGKMMLQGMDTDSAYMETNSAYCISIIDQTR